MDRLRVALRNSAINRDKLAKKTGIPEKRLDEIVAGSSPRMSELRPIASALGLRLDDFRTPTEQESKTELLFRSAVIGGEPVDDVVRSHLSRRVADPLSLISTKPSVGPIWHGEFIRDAGKAEENASVFRSLFCDDDQLSPLLSLPRIVEERMGVVLLVIRNQEVDGASGYLDSMPFILVSARFQPRMLFTLAHEVGHLISHHDPTKSVALIDQNVASDGDTGDDTDIEREANAFASALLMPSQALGMSLKTIRNAVKSTDEELGDIEINFLARIFGVSFSVAAIRCERLGLLPAGGASALYKEVCARYESPEKRAEQAGLPSRPQIRFPSVPTSLLTSAVERVLAGEVSIGRAAEALEVSIEDIYEAHAGGHA